MEAFHSMNAPSLTICPECGKPGLLRQMGSGAGIIFKGSGFYQTDYKNTKTADTKSNTATSGTEKTETSKDSSTKTESKTESKAESKTKV